MCRREALVRNISSKKWEFRLKGESYNKHWDDNIRGLIPRDRNLVKNLPKEASLYFNLLCAMCPKCEGRRMDANHLKVVHAVEIEGVREMVEKVHVVVDKGMAKCSRREKLDFTTRLFTSKINIVKKFMGS